MVIHATGGGSSAIINSDGHLIKVAAQTLETTLLGLVQARTGLTPFVQFGDWIGLLCVCILSGLFLFKPKIPTQS
jgi:apolipoprotein N-acyltransferase